MGSWIDKVIHPQLGGILILLICPVNYQTILHREILDFQYMLDFFDQGELVPNIKKEWSNLFSIFYFYPLDRY